MPPWRPIRRITSSPFDPMLTRAVLQVLLTSLGKLMAVASKRSKRFRRQVSRDLIVEVRSTDGARQQFLFDGTTRAMSAPISSHRDPEVSLVFPTAREGLRILLSRRRVGKLVESMNAGHTRIDGNPVLILWFHGMTRVVAPIGSSRRPRKPAPFPIRGPATTESYASRIVYEPPVAELSRDWPAAWAAREKLLQLRGPEGDPLPPG